MYKTQVLITGAVPSQGSFKNDSGEMVAYNSINFFCQMPLASGKGFATAEHKLKNRAEDFEKIFGAVELPAVFELTYIETTNGRGRTIREYTDIVPVKKGA